MARYKDAVERIVAMQKEALNTLTGGAVDAVPYWPYQQEAFPYFTNRMAASQYADGYSEDVQNVVPAVAMRLVVGHLTEGYRGELALAALDYIDAVEDYFVKHPMLTTNASGAYPNEPSWLFEQSRLLSNTGLVVFVNGGIGATQIGVEWTLQIPFIRSVLGE